MLTNDDDYVFAEVEPPYENEDGYMVWPDDTPDESEDDEGDEEGDSHATR